MAEGLAIFGGVSAAWGLAKDVRGFARKLKRAGCDIKQLDLRLDDDVYHLDHCRNVLHQYEHTIHSDHKRHLYRIVRQIKNITLGLKRQVDGYSRAGKWERVIWAVNASSLKQAELDLSEWIQRLRAALTDQGLFDLSNASSASWSNPSQHPNNTSASYFTDVTGPTLFSSTHVSRDDAATESKFVDLTTMRDEIDAAMTSSLGAPSISKHVILSIIANHGLKAIIQQDKSLQARMPESYGEFDLDTFAAHVASNAQILMAIIVFIEADLALLREFVVMGINDASLPIQSSVLDSLPFFPPSKRADFIKWQSAFRTSDNDTQLIKYTPHVQLLTNNGSKTPSCVPRVSSTLLGEGAFGRVYRTSMDYSPSSGVSEWGFCPERQKQPAYFAVKCFLDPHGPESYRREIEVLRELRRKPHDSIVPLLASWKDSGGCFNIIFPLANMNLRQMIGLEPPQMDRSFMNNLQTQLHGLADGLRHIHTNLRGPGWHHDIKPENILVFPDCWKIADFGMSRFESHGERPKTNIFQEQSRNGTTAYLPPEKAEDTQGMQRADMWSYACTMLEIMEWVFKPPGDNAQQLLRKRLGDGMATGNPQPDAFWYTDPSRNARLRPSVISTVETIRTHPACTRGMASVMALILKLFAIKPSSRLTAEHLTDSLKLVLVEEERLLDEDPLFYIRLVAQARMLAENSAPIPRNPTKPISPFQHIFRLPWRRKSHDQDMTDSRDAYEGLSEPFNGLNISGQTPHITRRRRQYAQAQRDNMTS